MTLYFSRNDFWYYFKDDNVRKNNNLSSFRSCECEIPCSTVLIILERCNHSYRHCTHCTVPIQNIQCTTQSSYWKCVRDIDPHNSEFTAVGWWVWGWWEVYFVSQKTCLERTRFRASLAILQTYVWVSNVTATKVITI